MKSAAPPREVTEWAGTGAGPLSPRRGGVWSLVPRGSERSWVHGLHEVLYTTHKYTRTCTNDLTLV